MGFHLESKAMTEEVKTFNVKNTSVRLVHIGGVAIAPEKIRAIVDDELGINRADVESSLYLEETDEEAEPVAHQSEQAPTKKAAKKTAAKNTATGAGWSANK